MPEEEQAKEPQQEEEENKQEEEEPKVEPEKIDKAFERRKDRVAETVEGAEDIQSKDLEAKLSELKTLEGRIDRKNRELKRLVKEAEHHGKSLAGDAVVEDQDARIVRECNEYLKSTGLSIE